MIIELNKQKNTIILVFFYSLVILFALITFRDFGIHIEEKFHRLNGHYWLNYISKIFGLVDIQKITEVKMNNISDYSLSSVSRYNKYGIVFDLPAAALEIIFKIEDVKNAYYFRHILSFLIFLMSSFFFYKILFKRYKNFFLSFTGLILYISTPRILGDSFLYKDVLFLSFFMFSIYCLINLINKFTFRNILIFSLLSALTVNLRIFALLIPVFLIFLVVIKNFYLMNLINDLKKILIYFICFSIFLYVFWPYLWSDPYNNFIDLFKSLKKDLINVKIFYNNNYVSNRTLPDTYILNWIFISSPFFQTILFLFGYVYCFIRLIKRFIKIKKNTIYNDLWRSKEEEIDFIFLFFLTLIYFFFIFFNAPLYNGWRLVYFFNIFLIYFSINFLFNLKNIYLKKKFAKLFTIFCFFLIGYNIYAIIKTHPFQSLYFNSLVSEKTKNSYEGDYYGLATKHFFENIIQKDKREIVNVAVASHTPLQRGLEAISLDLKKRIRIVGQEYHLADYIFKNNISEVNSNLINKYQIPKNFSKIYQLQIDKITIYEVFKLNKVSQ